MKKITRIDKTLKKILLIGANGFLGHNIIEIIYNTKSLNQDCSIIAADLNNDNLHSDFPFYMLDITNERSVIQKMKQINPEIVILTAAITDVDACENNKALATQVNTIGPKNVFKGCKQLDTKIVFLSTDFIFDGEKSGNYTEADNPNPISHYGLTKLQAELALQQSELDYLICRTAVLYGWNKTKLNFITWILENLSHGKKINILTNQINSPTYAPNLAEMILHLIENKSSGIYHTAGNGAYSRYEMALKCAKIFGYNEKLINPIDNFEQNALRPPNAGLDISKIHKELGSKLDIFSLDEGLHHMREHPLNRE